MLLYKITITHTAMSVTKGIFVLAKYKVVNGNLEYELVDLVKKTTRISKLKEKDSIKSYMMTDVLRDFRYLNDKGTKTKVNRIFSTFGYQDLIDLAIKASKSTYDYSTYEDIIYEYEIIINDNIYKYNEKAKEKIIENIIKHISTSNLKTLLESKLSLITEYYFVQKMVDVLVDREDYNYMIKLIAKNIEMFDKNDIRKFTKLALMNYKYNKYSFYVDAGLHSSLPDLYIAVIYKQNEETEKYEYISENDNETIHDFSNLSVLFDKNKNYYRYSYSLIKDIPGGYPGTWEHFEKNDKKRRTYIGEIIKSYMTLYNADLSLVLEFLIYDLNELVLKVNQLIKNIKDTGRTPGLIRTSPLTNMQSNNLFKTKETKMKIEEDIRYLEEMEKAEGKYKFGGEGYVESGKDYSARLSKK